MGLHMNSSTQRSWYNESQNLIPIVGYIAGNVRKLIDVMIVEKEEDEL